MQVRFERILKSVLSKFSVSNLEKYVSTKRTSRHLASGVQVRILLLCWASNAIKLEKSNEIKFTKIQFTKENQTKTQCFVQLRAFEKVMFHKGSVDPPYSWMFGLKGTVRLVLRSGGVIGASCSTEGTPGSTLALGHCCATAFATCGGFGGNEVKILVMRCDCLLHGRIYSCLLGLERRHRLKLLT